MTWTGRAGHGELEPHPIQIPTERFAVWVVCHLLVRVCHHMMIYLHQENPSKMGKCWHSNVRQKRWHQKTSLNGESWSWWRIYNETVTEGANIAIFMPCITRPVFLSLTHLPFILLSSCFISFGVLISTISPPHVNPSSWPTTISLPTCRWASPGQLVSGYWSPTMSFDFIDPPQPPITPTLSLIAAEMGTSIPGNFVSHFEGHAWLRFILHLSIFQISSIS